MCCFLLFTLQQGQRTRGRLGGVQSFGAARLPGALDPPLGIWTRKKCRKFMKIPKCPSVGGKKSPVFRRNHPNSGESMCVGSCVSDLRSFGHVIHGQTVWDVGAA